MVGSRLYGGELCLGNGRSGSSRRGKKSNNNSANKPKLPRRGLGVAQLEKIRLHDQMMADYLSSLHPPPFHANLMINKMGFGGGHTTDTRFDDYYSGATASYDIRSSSNNMTPPHHMVKPAATLLLLTQTMEDSVQKKIQQDQRHSMGSTGQNSDSAGDSQELDLELKL